VGQLKEVLAVCQYGVILRLLGCHLMAEGLREGEGKKEERWRRQIGEGSRERGRGGKGGRRNRGRGEGMEGEGRE